jgi:hypothetical protein
MAQVEEGEMRARQEMVNVKKIRRLGTPAIQFGCTRNTSYGRNSRGIYERVIARRKTEKMQLAIENRHEHGK